MPIYAYRCATCGHAQDVLQKMSDPVLGVCPACGAASYVKQVTAAGFQLKGSGWYVTDFRGDKKTGKAADGADAKSDDKGGKADASDAKAPPAGPADAEGGSAKKKADAGPAPAASAAASPTAAPAPAPAASPAPSAASGKTGT